MPTPSLPLREGPKRPSRPEIQEEAEPRLSLSLQETRKLTPSLLLHMGPKPKPSILVRRVPSSRFVFSPVTGEVKPPTPLQFLAGAKPMAPLSLDEGVKPTLSLTLDEEASSRLLCMF